jgi:MoxR-like ATPase
VAAVVMPVLRHRLVLNYHAQANALSADDLLGDVLTHVKRPYATD